MGTSKKLTPAQARMMRMLSHYDEGRSYITADAGEIVTLTSLHRKGRIAVEWEEGYQMRAWLKPHARRN